MNFQEIYDKAHRIGVEAVENAKIEPMIVGTPKDFFSSEFDPDKPQYFVEDGPCGFAEIVIKPGNGKFANWLKKNEIAERRSYGGGVSIWVSDFGQSYQKKMAYARAVAEVFREYNLNAFPRGRLD